MLSQRLPFTSKVTATVCGVLAGVVLVMLVAWVLGDPTTNLATDWLAFDNAADRLIAGEEIYRPIDIDEEPFPYLYPPFALALTLPLAAFGFLGSWAISAAFTMSTFLAGLWLAQRALNPDRDRVASLVIAVSTGTFMATVLIAQYSGVYVLAFGLVLWLWVNDRPGLAGLALAIMLMKPNIGIAVPVVLVWSRSWRALVGFLVGALMSFVVSLPFGLSRWGEFFASVQDQLAIQQDGLVPVDKMVTFVGGLQATFGLESTSPVTVGFWLVTSLIVGVATISLWSPKHLEGNIPRALGSLAIFVVVANPRLYFYDASLVVFGVFVLWHERHRLGLLVTRWLPCLAVGLWVASWGTLFSGLNAVVAPLGAGVVVLVALEAARGKGSLSEAPGIDFVEDGGEDGRHEARAA